MPQGSGSMRPGRGIVLAFALVAFAVLTAPSARAVQPNAYVVTPLVSNIAMPGVTTDAHLVNGWGLVAGPTTPWWVSDNGADLSTLYAANGTKLALEVAVPGAPTGIVFNGNASLFPVGSTNAGARFIFSTESGRIFGWAQALGPVAEMKANSSAAHAIYKGLAIATTAAGTRIYATDFANARVDVFSSAWTPVSTSGGFADPGLPAGYAPFGIQTIGARIFVTFAKQGPSGDDVGGVSLGFVDAFDADGNLLARVASRGMLNAPWGLAMAPESFGVFGGDLLVGNFGDGHILAYRELSNGRFAYMGALQAADGRFIEIDGLWALQFGHGAPNNGPVDTLFFTAGPNDEADGLFGSITAG